jgi:hypothetical protein
VLQKCAVRYFRPIQLLNPEVPAWRKLQTIEPKSFSKKRRAHWQAQVVLPMMIEVLVGWLGLNP